MSRELKYLGCVLDESSTDEGGCCNKVVVGRRVEGAIKDLQLEWYGIETMI